MSVSRTEALPHMTAWRIAALMLVANTVVFVIGMAVGGSDAGTARPSWLPPVWLRATIPLAVAAGLWFGHRWAWWVAIVGCSVFLLWAGLASVVLGLGGYFTGERVGFRTLHLGLLLATWLAALALLLSGAGRAVGRAHISRLTDR
jgi:hypothetical protein